MLKTVLILGILSISLTTTFGYARGENIARIRNACDRIASQYPDQEAVIENIPLGRLVRIEDHAFEIGILLTRGDFAGGENRRQVMLTEIQTVAWSLERGLERVPYQRCYTELRNYTQVIENCAFNSAM